MKTDVFISYSSVDKVAADAACNVFERNGLRCWIAPRDVTPGSYAQAIITAIENTKVMVVVVSQSSSTSAHVSREIDCAISNNVTIVPIRIEDVVPTQSMKYYLATAHWLDAFPPPYDRNFEAIANRIKKQIEGLPQDIENRNDARGLRQPRRETRNKLMIGAVACVAALAFGLVVWLRPGGFGLSNRQSVGGLTSCDKPAELPETPAGRVNSFWYYDPHAIGEIPLRQWVRIKGDLWQEKSAKATHFSDVTARIHFNFCDGTIVTREDDKNAQLFIPDNTCEDKTLRFRRLPPCDWGSMPVMVHVNGKDD